jgi:biotin-dependent carboxylase-like uncharacterized protein
MATVEAIEILSPGLQTTIQDLGRFGFGHYGVPPSGALDSFALRIANRLVDNPEDQAGLETTLMGLRLKALTDVCLAVTGAHLRPQVNNRPLEMWRSHVLKKDEILSFAGPENGCRAYVAFGGKLKMVSLLGSVSTNLPAGFGGLEGRSLQKGDVLQIETPHSKLTAAGREVRTQWIPDYPGSWTLRFIWGPQDTDFTDEAKRVFTHSPYAVASQSDRTGIRLNGTFIERKKNTAESIISEGLIAGCVQVPGDGKPIIILGETVTGGYRKIATVVSADLPLLGQIKPGDEVRFEPVSMDVAQRALLKMEDTIKTAVLI